MVNQKFGTPAVGVRQLEVYTTAVAVATNKPPKLPRDAHWRSLMDDLSRISCEDYRSVSDHAQILSHIRVHGIITLHFASSLKASHATGLLLHLAIYSVLGCIIPLSHAPLHMQIVYKHPHFISYFRNATPEEELANLNIGSRPARRKQGGGLETLRAIPWIFAWTQTRLVLPAWLGIGAALSALFDQAIRFIILAQIDLHLGLATQVKGPASHPLVIGNNFCALPSLTTAPLWWGSGDIERTCPPEQGYKGELRLMYEHWPFFQSTIDLVEMILAKADVRIAALYDDLLVTASEEKRLGLLLRQKFQQTVDAVLEVSGECISNRCWSKLAIDAQPALQERMPKRKFEYRAAAVGLQDYLKHNEVVEGRMSFLEVG